MRVLLEASSHKIQQFWTKAIPFLDVDEIIEHFSAIEALERMRKHHAVNVYTKEVEVRILLQLIQLFTGVSLQSLL